MNLLSLLQNKNRCLKKLFELTQSMIGQCVFEENSTNSTTAFHATLEKRARMIEALQLYDKKIDLLTQSLFSQSKPEEIRNTPFGQQLTPYIQEANSLCQSILQVDQQLVQNLERQKTRIVTVLLQSDKQKNLLQKFKSSWVPESGMEIDGIL